MAKFPYKSRPPLSLDEAVNQTMTDLGGLEAVAALPGVRVGRSVLYKYTDQEARANVIPMDIAAVLTMETVRRGHEPHLLRWLEERTTGARQHVAAHESLVDLVTQLGEDASCAFRDLGKALKSGRTGAKMSPKQRDELLKDLRDVARVAAAGIDALSGEGS